MGFANRFAGSMAAYNMGLLVALLARCDQDARRLESWCDDGFQAARHRAQRDDAFVGRALALDQVNVGCQSTPNVNWTRSGAGESSCCAATGLQRNAGPAQAWA